MAILTENYDINGREFTRTWSDEGRYVVREGVSYVEANDPTEFGRTYTEGGFLPPEEAEEVIDKNITDKAEAYDILMGDSE